MIIFREKTYSYFSSSKANAMLKRITTKLDSEREENYDVETSIPDDVISVNLDLDNLKIYIPEEFEYSQYSIDNRIRTLAGYVRTETRFERDIYIMELTSKITFDQYYKIIKFIIQEEGFCSIVNH